MKRRACARGGIGYGDGMEIEGKQAMDAEALAAVRADFPILGRYFDGKPLVYLDNAASTQKPRAVIERVSDFYANGYANIHRGVYRLSAAATAAYEGARATIARAIGAAEPGEVVFTRGATESVNLLASCLGESWGPKDSVLVSEMEHHANIVPWQLLAARKGVRLRVAPITDSGELDMAALEAALRAEPPTLLSVVWVSNAMGSVNPVEAVIALARAHGVPVMIDASQAVPHFDIDVQALGADYLVFSGHKVYGPTGIGVLWGRKPLLEALPPYQGGGDMIDRVSFSGTTYRGAPERFEAGTPHIAGAIGLASAFEYLAGLDRRRMAAHEAALLEYAQAGLADIVGLRVVGQAAQKASVVSFVMDCAHPHDIATVLDADRVAIRTGHHCCQPLMQRFGLTGTARASLAFYNSFAEVDALVAGVRKAQALFS